MVELYYYLIVADYYTNINQLPKRYREPVTEFIADYGYIVAEDGTITKAE